MRHGISPQKSLQNLLQAPDEAVERELRGSKPPPGVVRRAFTSGVDLRPSGAELRPSAWESQSWVRSCSRGSAAGAGTSRQVRV